MLANVPFRGKNNFNYEWALHLILYNDKHINKVFMATLGHELIHLDGDWEPKFDDCVHSKRFVQWTNEVHADMGATLKFPQLSRSDLIYAAHYKRNVKLKAGRNDTERDTHPSWSRRIGYIRDYDFNRELIQKIADDTQCTDAILVSKAIKFFPDIILK